MSSGVPVSEARALLSTAPRREVLFHAWSPGLLLRVVRPHFLTFSNTEAEEGSSAHSAGSGVAEAGRCRSARGRLRLCLLVLLRSVVLPLLPGPGDRLENWEGGFVCGTVWLCFPNARIAQGPSWLLKNYAEETA